MTIFSDDKFVIESGGFRFEDSIVIPIDEYNAQTEGDRQQMKVDRFTIYRDRITHPVAPEEDVIPEVPIHDNMLLEQAEGEVKA